MSLHARRPLIIVFVLGAMALGLVMLYSFGGRDMVTQHESFLVYFDDTLNGLVRGSLVRFKGVPIGYVDGIRFDYRQPGDKRIPVLIQINVDRLQHQLGVLEDLYVPSVLAAQVRRGLRAELDTESYVTGQMFIELEYHNPAPPITPASIPAGRPDVPVIPAMPSEVVADMQKMQDTIAWLPTFDFRTEIEKVGAKLDNLTTAVAVFPYAEDSQRLQKFVRPLEHFNFNAWQRSFDNFQNRFDRYQFALNDAKTNFYAQSQDFVSMNHEARSQLEQMSAQLAALRGSFRPDDPALSHLSHNLEQLSKDLQNLTRKIDAVQQQPGVLDKLTH